jgi:hypothetical protein
MTDENKDLEFIKELTDGSVEKEETFTEEEKANFNNDGHTDFDDEAPSTETKSEKKDDKKKPEASKKKEEPKGEELSDNEKRLQGELESTEKRRKDTEVAFQAANQEKIRLQAIVDKQKTESTPKPGATGEEDEESLLFGTDDPDGETKKGDGPTKAEPKEETVTKAELDDVKRRQDEAETQRNIDNWKTEVDKVKADGKHDDFDFIVYDIFNEALETSPAVQEKFEKKGSSPEAAYELGLEIKKYKDALDGKKNDDNKEEVIGDPEEEEEELDPSSALGGNSAGTSTKPSSSPTNVVSNVNSFFDS